jgi:ankyrin repeat protein
MFAADHHLAEMVEYLSLRNTWLDEEDANSITILMHFLFAKDFKGAYRLIIRGANIDYVNRNGNTALHLCIQNEIVESIDFLLGKGANPHIMDLNGQDACDMAKKRGLARRFSIFNDCNPHMKQLPKMPDGNYAKVEAIVFTGDDKPQKFEYAK